MQGFFLNIRDAWCIFLHRVLMEHLITADPKIYIFVKVFYSISISAEKISFANINHLSKSVTLDYS